MPFVPSPLRVPQPWPPVKIKSASFQPQLQVGWRFPPCQACVCLQPCKLDVFPSQRQVFWLHCGQFRPPGQAPPGWHCCCRGELARLRFSILKRVEEFTIQVPEEVPDVSHL